MIDASHDMTTAPSHDSGAMTVPLATAILQAALDCIVVIDHYSRVVEWNEAAECTFGYSRAEALGRDLAELVIPAPFRQAHYQGVAKYLATGSGPILNERIEVTALRRDGSEFPVELAIVPIEETTPRFAAYLRDITARSEHEIALQRSEERFRSLVAASSEIVWVREPDGTFASQQPEWTAFTGQPYEQLRGWGWLDSIFPDDRAKVAGQWSRAVREKSLYSAEYRMRRHDGAYRHMSARAVPVLEADGRIREWVGVNTDITAQKDAEEALVRSEARQRHFLRDMLASVTEGKLMLCDTPEDLPHPLPALAGPIRLASNRLHVLRRRVVEAARIAALDDERINDLMTAIGEASMNAVVHAGGGVSQIGVDPEQGTVQVWVEDEGGGIEINHLPQATLYRGYTTAGTLGHGFKLLLSTADRVWLLTGPRSTTVVLSVGRIAPQPGWLSPK